MKKNIIIFGIINTIVVFGITINAIYNSHINAFVISLSPLFITFILAIIASWHYKKQNPETASFRNLFLSVLGGLTVGLLFGTLLTVFFFLSLSEETKMILENTYLENQFTALSHLSDSLAFMDAIEKASEQLFSIEYQLLGMPIVFIVNAVITAIVALGMKKEYPVPA